MVARVLFALVLLCLPVFSQEEMHEYVQVDLVDLYLTATNNKGRFVQDLKREDIQVFEDGVPQRIEQFSSFAGTRGEVPLLLAMVMDNSGSMDSDIGEIRRLDLARNAALSLLKQLGTMDEVMLWVLSDSPMIPEAIKDPNKAETALVSMQPSWGQTAVVDSLASVLAELRRIPGRKLLFLCSDGQDNLSKTRFKDMINMAIDTPDLTIVVLGIGATNAVFGVSGPVRDIPDVPYLRSKEYLQRLADSTAGFAYFPENEKDVKNVLDQIGGFIRSQYSLSYRSSNGQTGPGRRRIEITTRRKGITLHYRQSYALE